MVKNKVLSIALSAMLSLGMMSSFAMASEIDPQAPEFAEQTTEAKTTSEPEQPGMKAKASASYFFGVDVSEHDGANVDWAKAKKAGVKFAIIRVACAGWSTGNVFSDKYYERNIKEASKNGIKVGAYIYSQATTKAEAQAEANYIVNKLKPLKSYINMPVVWDMESPTTYTYSGNTYKTYWGKHKPTKGMTKTNWLAFAKIVKDAGYTPMFYSYTYWCKDNVAMTMLNEDGYPFWLAEYTTASTPTKYHGIWGDKYPYDMWQYSSTKSVSGIGGDVDCNRWYTSDINKYSKSDFVGKAAPTISTITETSFKATWSKVNGATKYVVEIKTADGTLAKKATTTDLSYTANDLTPNAEYLVTVLAYKDSDPGKKSDGVAAKTLEKTPYDKTVTLSAKNGTSSAKIAWTVEPQATKYVIVVSNDRKAWKKLATVTGKSYTITGLSNGAGKFVRVIPYRGSEQGKASRARLVHGKLKYTVKDSKKTIMVFRIGNVYYDKNAEKGVGKITVTAKTKDNLNIRAKKSASSKKIATIPKGKTVTVKQLNAKWDKVTYKKGSKSYTGYVNNSYLK